MDAVTFNIRAVSADQIDPQQLSDFAARNFPAACPPTLPREDIDRFITKELSPQKFAERLSDPNARVLVSSTGTAVTGYALILHGVHPEAPKQWQSARTSYLSKLYVDSSQRGSGLARALLDAALDTAREHGCAALWLGVNSENHRARAFYAKSGLTLAGCREFTVGTHTFIDDMFATALE